MRKQCKKCPWRTNTDPTAIPNGYCEVKHRALSNTISTGLASLHGAPKAMACHESPVGAEKHCVGWLANQLGPGNNIALRIRAMTDPALVDFELDGPQHERFQDTLP